MDKKELQEQVVQKIEADYDVLLRSITNICRNAPDNETAASRLKVFAFTLGACESFKTALIDVYEEEADKSVCGSISRQALLGHNVMTAILKSDNILWDLYQAMKNSDFTIALYYEEFPLRKQDEITWTILRNVLLQKEEDR